MNTNHFLGDSTEHVFSNAQAFNFDVWLELAQSDPEAFEYVRYLKVQDALSNFEKTSRNHLAALCVRIDIERAKANTPMEGLLWMLGEMGRNLGNIGDQYNEFSQELNRAKALCDELSSQL